MQNFVGQNLPVIQADGCLYSVIGNGPVAFINARDIAAVTVKRTTGHASRFV